MNKPSWMIQDKKVVCQDECCCNCAHFLEVFKHPWNLGSEKGSMSELMGWACNLFVAQECPSGGLVFNNRGHGLCECYQKKSDKSCSEGRVDE